MRLKPVGLRELLIWLAVCWLAGFAGFTLLYFQMGGMIG
jgi:hypothetical protein